MKSNPTQSGCRMEGKSAGGVAKIVSGSNSTLNLSVPILGVVPRDN